MTKKYIITNINNIICGFLLENGQAKEIKAYEPQSMLGNIYVGKVSNIVSNIDSAFIDIQKGLSCYMPLEDYFLDKKLKIGDLLPVQLNKEAIKSKAPSVTTKLSLDGEYVVVMFESHKDKIGVSSKIRSEDKREELKAVVKEALDTFKAESKLTSTNYGIILRTKSEEANTEYIKQETITLLCKLDCIVNKAKFEVAYSCIYQKTPLIIKDILAYNSDNIDIITDLPEVIACCKDNDISSITFYNDDTISLDALYSLKTHINKALNKRVYLKSGAYLVIDPTEAMTVIDVNSGKSIKGSNKEEKVLSINLEAAREIANQLILRNISGIIIVDFISMENELSKNTLLKEFRSYTEGDKIKTTVVDITRLGLIEVTRKRISKPLHEVIK